MIANFKRIVCVAAVAVAVAGTHVNAQVYYTFPGAPIVSDSKPAAGGVIGFGDNLLRLVGYGRFNVSTKMDLGLELVIDDLHGGGDSVWRGGAAANVRYAIIPSGKELPFDLSAEAGLGFEAGGSITNIDVPIGANISRPLKLDNGKHLTPFGGLFIRIFHTSFDAPPGYRGDTGNTDLNLELRAGATFEVLESGDLFVSLHISDDVIFYVGFNAQK